MRISVLIERRLKEPRDLVLPEFSSIRTLAMTVPSR